MLGILPGHLFRTSFQTVSRTLVCWIVETCDSFKNRPYGGFIDSFLLGMLLHEWDTVIRGLGNSRSKKVTSTIKVDYVVDPVDEADDNKKKRVLVTGGAGYL